MQPKFSFRVLAFLGIGLFSLLLVLIFRGKSLESAQIVENHSAQKQVWTCAMDPQIKAESAGKCPICGMNLMLEASGDLTEIVPLIPYDAVRNSEFATQVAEVQEEAVTLLLDGSVKLENGEKIARFYCDLKNQYDFRKGRKLLVQAEKRPEKTFYVRLNDFEIAEQHQDVLSILKCDLPEEAVDLAENDALVLWLPLPPDRSKNWLRIPKHALGRLDARDIVYVRDPGSELPVYHMREVHVIASNLHHAWLDEGLRPGEEVLIAPAHRIDELLATTNLENLGGIRIEPDPQKSALDLKFYPELLNQNVALAPDFSAYLQELFERYFQLQADIFDAKSFSAAKSASQIVAWLSDSKAIENDAKANAFWEIQRKIIRSEADIISGTKSAEIQRTHFAQLSPPMIRLAKAFSVISAYHHYCPLALHNEGAHWLSRTDTIFNPFFGVQMPHCGKLVEVFEGE